MTLEQLVWDARTAEEAHALHHRGHEVHNKTHEELTHLTFGYDLREDVTFLAEAIHVHRTVIEVDSHRALGQRQRIEGWGDTKLKAIWRFWNEATDHLGVLGGVKLPTGSTQEINPLGTRYHNEFQPGTGSTDALAGMVFKKEANGLRLYGNAVGTLRGDGDHGFGPSDNLTSYVILDGALPLGGGRETKAWIGLDTNLQIEDRHSQDGVENPDSGGTTLLMGPVCKLDITGGFSLLVNILFPVYQDLGGVHQKVDLVWNASARVSW